MAKRDIPKAYEPGSIEPRWAQKWVEERLYTPEVAAEERSPDRPSFSLAIPPPNVTGMLHMGHMLEHTQIDILMRWRRMLGHRVLWLPGTDHAGIATQVVVERQLTEAGTSRHELGRDEFEKRVWQWKEESGGTIKKQMVRLGASCDWTREHFTLEPKLYRAVLEAFLRLYREGLIYRGRRIVNWCPRCHTALSDLEVEHSERDAKLYHVRYPLASGTGHVVIATTRPETMLGDTAVAVHPEDDRHRALVGQKVVLPLLDREIPVIADDYVDREFGTGALKITPGHDPNDFEIGQRHKLEQIDVFDNDAVVNDRGGPYRGLDRFAARKKIVADLEARGLLEKVEGHRHAVGACQRCKTLLEPKISEQWFCRMKPLAEPAIEVVRSGRIKILPENWKKVYLDWMERIHDWCISRQLWWGHRIPVWHCTDCAAMTPARDSDVEVVDGRAQAAHPPEKCSECGETKLEQDPDVLDTWFSSGLWPFSTLGWPDTTPDLETYYPTTLMINGFDILFFWDARMIMMGLKLLPQEWPEERRLPFHTLYIHALVRDAERVKMSKTRGNVVDPLEVTERYGTDAVRFTLAVMAAPGTDIALSEDRIQSYRAFANKIWNAARFILMSIDEYEIRTGQPISNIIKPFPWPGSGVPRPPNVQVPSPTGRMWPGAQASVADYWILDRLMKVIETVDSALEEFRFHEASNALYHFFWHDFCDWYLEWVKPTLFSDSGNPNERAFINLLNVFEESLRLLHPFMPFITEELWQKLPHTYSSIAVTPYPPHWAFPLLWERQAESMALLQEAITALRNIRAEMKLDPRKPMPAELGSEDPAVHKLFEENREAIVRLANLSELKLALAHLGQEDGRLRHAARFDAHVPFTAEDLDAELNRLRKEMANLEKQRAGAQAKLSNRQFLDKAPEHVVANMKAKQVEIDAKYEKVSALFSRLESRRQSGDPGS